MWDLCFEKSIRTHTPASIPRKRIRSSRALKKIAGNANPIATKVAMMGRAALNSNW